jgi:hypothetical protein
MERVTYKVYVGEVGNNEGHLVGSTKNLRGAKMIAGRERNKYKGDGWSVIRGDDGTEIRAGRRNY